MKLKLFFGFALLGIFILAGCDTPETATPTVESEATFVVNIPDAYDGDFNPDGLDVGPEVGQLAPEIEGNDLDGIPFKLSDYRGKVVMLDFYGDW